MANVIDDVIKYGRCREKERERRKRNRNPKGKPYNIIDKVEGQARGKQGPK